MVCASVGALGVRGPGVAAFRFEDLLNAGPRGFMSGITDLDIHMQGGTPILYAMAGDIGVSCFALTGGGAQYLDRNGVSGPAQAGVAGQIAQLDLAGGPAMAVLGLQTGALQYFDLAANGAMTRSGQITAPGGLPGAVVALEQVTLGGVAHAYVSHFGQDGLTLYRLGADGTLTERAHFAGTGAAQAADLVAIEEVTAGGHRFLVTASALEDSVTVHAVAEGGGLTRIGSLGADEGLGLDTPGAVVPVTLAGQSYLVVAGRSSGSLSVMRLDAGGGLTATDHVIDSLETRFSGIAALEQVTVNGQVFLVGGGRDDGLSLFTLLRGGRLLHLARIADDAAMSLSDISAIALRAEGGVLHVYASGEDEAGITHLSVDLGTLSAPITGGSGGSALSGTAGGDLIDGGGGNDRIRGLGGDDILIDGTGRDTLDGGAGADIFVLTRDGETDVIEGFEIGVDRLDLSQLGYLRNLGQVTITATQDGARLIFAGEELRLISHDFRPLSAADFSLADVTTLDHLPVGSVTQPALYPNPGPALPLYVPVPVMRPTEGADLLTGTDGNDSIDALGGNDTLRGGDGHDLLQGGGGEDRLDGGSHNDRLFGGAGHDILQGGAGFDTLDGGWHNDLLDGGSGNDTLRGGAHEDRANGGAGHDALWGEAGHDTLNGDDGDDTLDGGWHNDWLYGGEGADLIRGDGGVDRLFGHGGDDTLEGGDGDDIVYAGLGGDVLRGGPNEDRLDGGGGNDALWGDGGHDTLIGSDGADTLSGGWHNDWLYGGADGDLIRGDGGVDRLFGEAGDDVLEGGDGCDIAYAGPGADTLRGGPNEDLLDGGPDGDLLQGEGGHDTLIGSTGDDTLEGGWHNDWLYGGSGNDVVRGDGGVDRMFGHDGNDLLDGGHGADILYAGAGNDIVRGGTGDDRIDGGAGDDWLSGGLNNDTFVFANGFGDDTITDFGVYSALERIDLSAVSAIRDYGDLRANHMVQRGADVLIDDGAGNTITVLNTPLAAMDPGDFLF